MCTGITLWSPQQWLLRGNASASSSCICSRVLACTDSLLTGRCRDAQRRQMCIVTLHDYCAVFILSCSSIFDSWHVHLQHYWCISMAQIQRGVSLILLIFKAVSNLVVFPPPLFGGRGTSWILFKVLVANMLARCLHSNPAGKDQHYLTVLVVSTWLVPAHVDSSFSPTCGEKNTCFYWKRVAWTRQLLFN